MGKNTARRAKETWRQIENRKQRLAVIDFETDKFDYGVHVKPFAAGFYDGSVFVKFWGDDCVEQVIKYLDTLDEPHLIFAHNGGKFDFYFFLPYIHGVVKIVKSRLLQWRRGKHEFRDSWAILPFSLGEYQKDKINYDWFDRDKREQHKAAIIEYMKGDCVYLFDLVFQFFSRFGDSLTIGSMALRKLKSFHPFERLQEKQDDFLREFNFGGRTQCFKTGIQKGDWKIYDVNAMYPHVMATFQHPVSAQYHLGDRITPDTCFVCFSGTNDGALPTRTENGLDFNVKRGVFHATIHEIEAAEDLGLIKIDKILYTVDFYEQTTFKEFVEEYHALRREAQAKDDKAGNLLYKFLLNSSYGKFSQNPDNHAEYIVGEIGEYGEPWEPCEIHGPYMLYKKPSIARRYFNVATGASITGAARSILLRGIASASRPLYCDTDSLICELLDAEIDARRLGAWKLEATADTVVICGKKLYAVFASGKRAEDFARAAKKTLADYEHVAGIGYCIKQASKGVRLKAHEMVAVARGGTVEHFNPVPKFKRDGSAAFIKRRIKMTALPEAAD